MARKGKARRVQVPLSDSRYEGLERYAEMQGGSLANEASILFSNLIDEMMQDGRIPPPKEKEGPDNEALNQVKQFVLLMMGKRKRNGIAISEVAEYLDIDQVELNNLYQKTLETMEEAPCDK